MWDNVPVVASVLLSFLAAMLGGGFGAKIVNLAIKEEMRKTFATKEDVAEIKKQMNSISGVADRAQERSQAALMRANELQHLQEIQWQRVAEQVIKPLERITEQLQHLNDSQTKLATTIEMMRKEPDAQK